MPYLCSLPYWRKSWWNPFTCRPVVMMLEGQRLRAWDKHEALLYDTSVTEVHAHLSRLQTLVLHMNGQKWVFYGRGSGSSPDPTPGQRDAVKRFLHAHSEEPLPPNVGGPGLADQIFNESAGWHMRLWNQVLLEAGASRT